MVVLAMASLPRLRPPSHDLNRLPGPTGLPVLGNLLDIGNVRAHQTIAGWAQKWPLFRFQVLFTNHVVVTDPLEIAALGKGEGALPRPIDLIYQPFNQVCTLACDCSAGLPLLAHAAALLRRAHTCAMA
jgi:hypothetical protein